MKQDLTRLTDEELGRLVDKLGDWYEHKEGVVSREFTLEYAAALREENRRTGGGRMSLYDYHWARDLRTEQDPPFYGLVMAAMMKADTMNLARLRACWPEVWDEMQKRYMAPGAILETDPEWHSEEHQSVLKWRAEAGMDGDA